MRIAIVGAPFTGKTTTLCALTNQPYEAALAAQSSAKPREGIAKVADPRLEILRDHFKPKKYTPAVLEFLDTLPVALSGPDREKNRERLPAIKDTDGLLVVVSALDVDDPKTIIERARGQLAELRAEFLVADLGIVEKRAEKLRLSQHKPTPTQAQDKKELALLERILPHLNNGEPIASCPMAEEEKRLLRGFRFVSEKSILVALNITESRLGDAAALVAGLGGTDPVVVLSAKLELELIQLPEDERKAFMGDYGLTTLAAPAIVHQCFRLLGLVHFFTTGEDEVRAWTIHAGDDALTAAGKIHSDLARGFIAAEIYSYDDWHALGGSLKELRAHGKFRLEGKQYKVKDGDIINIKFNV